MTSTYTYVVHITQDADDEPPAPNEIEEAIFKAYPDAEVDAERAPFVA